MYEFNFYNQLSDGFYLLTMGVLISILGLVIVYSDYLLNLAVYKPTKIYET